ncbi:hypothetical protein [Bacillus subtilis]|uniref:hypothetical protein n=1 Tax=Bacillus subtilis TaxID=1423 RepID=UPI0024161ED7|nr:hypothetical protein [Bacillus subtilis]WFO97897.1 hypothetical protein JEQ25_12785 [Bacillus subtilis]
MSKGIIGEYNVDLNIFWFGANGCEYISYKNSRQVFVYPTHTHPAPPDRLIVYSRPIKTLHDFGEAIENGEVYKSRYTPTGETESGEEVDDIVLDKLRWEMCE